MSEFQLAKTERVCWGTKIRGIMYQNSIFQGKKGRMTQCKTKECPLALLGCLQIATPSKAEEGMVLFSSAGPKILGPDIELPFSIIFRSDPCPSPAWKPLF